MLALLIRVYPVHVPYIHPDQDWFPTMAMHSIAVGDWRPEMLVYPSALMYTLRIAYTVAYGVGHVAGRFADRTDFLKAYVEAPYPFLLCARIWSVILGVAGVVVVGLLGTRVLGSRQGPLAALFLAVAVLHVRESHYGSLDVPATTFFTAALLAAVTLHERPTPCSAVVTGFLVGITAAHRYQLGVVALAVPAAELLRARRERGVAARMGAAALAALGAFTVLSPYTFLDMARAHADVVEQLAITYLWAGPDSLPLPTLLGLAAGSAVCVVAIIGILVRLRVAPRTALIVLIPALVYAASLLPAKRVFARYTIPLLPVVALFAAAGVAACADALRGRARVGLWILGAIVIADPAGRSVAIDRLLAREDTRAAARRWILEHVPDGDTLVANRAPYAAPALPIGFEYRAARYGTELAAALRERGGGEHPAYRWAAVGTPGANARWVVTIEHPALAIFSEVPPPLAALLRAKGRRVAEFVAMPEGGAVFDPTDANYVPLRGFDRVLRPGPNISIWRVDHP